MSEEIFHDIIYKVRGALWKDHKCGSGSLLEHTVNIREALPQLVSKFNIKSILDAPCGDFSWMSTVQFSSDIKYIGGDIVGRMIDENRAKYPQTEFIKLDIVHNALPTVDLLFCRDLLIHLPNESVKQIFRNVVNSDIKYVLVSCGHNPKNDDIDFGKHREVNLRSAPFSFPEPLYTIDDSCRDAVRDMLLWERDQLVEVIDLWDN